MGEELAFKLKRGLLGCEQQERRTVRRREQFTANLREAAESFAAASGAEQESRLHSGDLSHNAAARQKNKVFYFMG